MPDGTEVGFGLPEGYDTGGFSLDPAGRANHIYYRDTDEVFHVNQATYAHVAKRSKGKPAPVQKLTKAEQKVWDDAEKERLAYEAVQLVKAEKEREEEAAREAAAGKTE